MNIENITPGFYWIVGRGDLTVAEVYAAGDGTLEFLGMRWEDGMPVALSPELAAEFIQRIKTPSEEKSLSEGLAKLISMIGED